MHHPRVVLVLRGKAQLYKMREGPLPCLREGEMTMDRFKAAVWTILLTACIYFWICVLGWGVKLCKWMGWIN